MVTPLEEGDILIWFINLGKDKHEPLENIIIYRDGVSEGQYQRRRLDLSSSLRRVLNPKALYAS